MDSIYSEIVAHETQLKRMAFKLTRNPVEAQDLYQETALRALEKGHLFKLGSNFGAWSYTIMRNHFINQFRRKKKGYLVDIDDVTPFLSDYVTEGGAEYQLMESEILALLDEVKPRYRKVINMLRDGYSYEEISEALELPLGTVKSNIHLARKQLKNIALNKGIYLN
ncbi:MAG: sigma-70 family RNA polymerase sigma factor [Saprospiraceae bacterium]|nr:sigma-70 family RNA polymerase sigma factor [Saprospiraceae bacterium]